MAAFLSSVFGAGWQFFTNQGLPLSGGLLYTYQAGTTTPVVTWTDSTQLVANANPIVLDSAGRLPTEIWIQSGSTYKFLLRDSIGNQLGVWDNVSGVNDVSPATFSEWLATGLTPSYISSTSFSVAGNSTALFQVNRRVQISVTAGTVYGYVVSATFNGTITTVVIGVDSIGLDAGISAVNVALLNSTNLSVPQQMIQMAPTVNVASATTTPIGAAPSINVNITGTNNISAFDNITAGVIRFIRFTGALTLVNGAALQTPGGVNYTTQANETGLARSLGSGNWELLGLWGSYGATFASGTRIGFQQTTVPTGWTKDTTAALNDSCFRVVTGAVGTGGTLGISSANTSAYTLQIADIPSHTHTVTYGQAASIYAYASAGGSQGLTTPVTSGATGGGGPHSHGLALKYVDFSIGQKN